MTRMYELDFIHSDMSEYNLLWWRDQVCLIDVSQMVSRNHPHANKFLMRDCCNLIRFFKKKGLIEVDDSKALFSHICGKDLQEKDLEFWNKIEDFPCNEKSMNRDNAQKKSSGNQQDSFECFIQQTSKDKDGCHSIKSSPDSEDAHRATTSNQNE